MRKLILVVLTALAAPALLAATCPPPTGPFEGNWTKYGPSFGTPTKFVQASFVPQSGSGISAKGYILCQYNTDSGVPATYQSVDQDISAPTGGSWQQGPVTDSKVCNTVKQGDITPDACPFTV